MTEKTKGANLHVLYSGSAEGGAQEFAYRLAGTLGFETYSIRRGSITRRLRQSGWVAVDKDKLLKRAYDKVVLSDLRALLWWVCQRSLSARKVYFVPHNDKLNRVYKLVKLILLNYQIIVLPTTRLQAITYRSSPDFFYLKKPKSKFAPAQKKTKTIAYWGRFGKEKRLTHLVKIFKESGLAEHGWRLLIIGDGPYPPKSGAPGVTIEQGWLDSVEIQSKVVECSFSINMRKEEGVSLMAIESLGMNIIPLFHSKKTASNYFKVGEYVPINSGSDLAEAVKKTYLAADIILDRFYCGASDIIEEIRAQ